ncbi:ATP-dependent Lhr-like helicase [Clavibacter michiganensis]|uniref:DNA glycosylase AlkZ-like family protein n=1 Tax=Clavibacter michiganensis TaxID=28447 RepID=UPI001AE50EFC|nr:crosslink repair DNA glycosylase YcaQ family protein [Clavibacter michiganensis]MBP2456411.1 ATP-dependent Lhr-like helicase [Clavibacter michiganensis]MDQ0408981.1 ATP-dependent Lhr-like helicase [Clavibacter michiganensis]
MDPVLARFSPATREWFQGAFPGPTAAQTGAWEAVQKGSHALVVAPTGSGKTLAAFLWSIDRLASRPAPEDPMRRTRVLYISPLKALAVDVERNLRSPLVGIVQTAKRLGAEPPEVTVGVRSGDTPAADRRSLAKTPPDILITTPESLFLMLTSAARETLAGVETVIVDEVHAVAATKRGSHLALSLERLDALLAKPAQRIGLSATVRPPEEVARFLGGRSPVSIVSPTNTKEFDLRVIVPVDDMTELGTTAPLEGSAAQGDAPQQGSIWPHVEEGIVDLVLQHTSSIVFTNSRRLAERLTARLNEIFAGRVEEGRIDAEGRAIAGGSATADADADAVPVLAGAAAGSGSSRPVDATAFSATRRTAARPPAEVMAQAGSTEGADPVLAKAHHGSVSKEQRALIEDDLKSGRLRCVVATSSLELGIDMGDVDLVVQVEAPPSVASGLQRVGRAGHQVGEVSRGVIFPKHRADLIHSAVAAERMASGQIESLRVPANPLDVLAQQTVAAVALEPVGVEEWFDIVRRSAPFATLPRSAYEATLDLLSGRYPSDEFAELRPRIVWDRDEGTIEGRPGAQRLAVTSGGTIPDRGLFGVFMVGEKASRVGELDEEMVYESRVGDVFALGATSWRIQEITHDRVLVTPAFGEPGKLPFWKGDGLGRPLELGRAIGAFVRELSGSAVDDARARAGRVGLDDRAVNNLLAFLDDQKKATGHVPNDRTLVVERFRDELGDWRVVLHSPYGMQVHAPWALAVGARVTELYGIDGATMANDDGIVVRIPETDGEPPGADLFVFEPDELDAIVTREVGGSALFASRFRECAARALLLPRYNPGRRSPLWQQRQRASQLLDVARKFPAFPIVLETVREVLQDVYDLPALTSLAKDIEARRIKIVETTTEDASPFARSLLFSYVGAFMYEGDSPLAERRAAALSLDAGLLSELLGRAELRELLDPAVIARTELELQRLAPDRRAKGLEGVADLLRILGPLDAEEVAARLEPEEAGSAADHLDALVAGKRALRVSFGGQPRVAAIEDASRLRDALGVPLPIGTPLAFVEPVADPLGDLVGRYARTHGPFTIADAATGIGLGSAVIADTLARLGAQRRVVEGEFRPGASGSEWCDVEVLRRLRSRSLAALRSEVEPVERAAYARFLPAWQHVAGADRERGLRGVDGVLQVIEQLAGAPVPASAWETLVLPARVRDYSPAFLDELTSTGEVIWSGAGTLAGADGWVSLHLADQVALTLPEPDAHDTDELQREILTTLGTGGGYFFRQLSDAVGSTDDKALVTALWDLVWAGLVTNDTLSPLRALLAGGSTAHKTPQRAPRGRMYRGGRMPRPDMPTRTGPSTAAGRWSIVPLAETDATVRAAGTAELLLERYGVVTRGSVMTERVPGGFALTYKVLAGFEDTGRARRGYFIETLGAAQFSTGGTVDRLRGFTRDPDAGERALNALTLAATDPANAYGAALPWPRLDGSGGGSDGDGSDGSDGSDGAGPGSGDAAADASSAVAESGSVDARGERPSGHRAGRKAGALVVLVDGELVLYVERGGKTVLQFGDDEAVIRAAAESLGGIVRRGGVAKLAIEKVNGAFILGTPLGTALQEHGFSATPRGLRMRS